MKNPILIFVLGLATVISLFFLTNPEKLVDDSTTPIPKLELSKKKQQIGTENIVLAQDLKSLRQELVKIKSELNRVTSRLSSQELATNTAEWDEPNPPSSLDELEDPETMEKRNKLVREQRRIALEDDFTKEMVDKTWSEENTSTILVALESLSGEIHEGVVLNSTECRSTTCRIEIEFDDEMAQQELEMNFPMLVGENFPRISATHVEHNGVTSSVYFLNSDKS